MRNAAPSQRWLHRFAVATAAATLVLIGIGGLVTSHGAGMAVPDWPTSYGYNMFALPLDFWKGGIFYEHTHRLWASLVGLMVVALTRWLGGARSRLTLAIVGLAEVIAGFGIFALWPHLKGTGHFLTGIGGVVLLAALVWVRNDPARPALVRLGWLAFGLVQFQGLLGGLRVVLSQNEIGIFHGALAQLFFLLLCVIALLTHPRWSGLRPLRTAAARPMRALALLTTAVIFGQLVLGATMRHQHAGLAIPDFPLAYGKLWPATDPESVLRYNQHRIETSAVDPITAFHIVLQMIHRIVAVVIFAGVTAFAWLTVRQYTWRDWFAKLALVWFGLIFLQVILGAATVWSQKAADIATAHVVVGALSLVIGTTLSIFCVRSLEIAPRAPVLSGDLTRDQSGDARLPGNAATQS